MKFTAWLMENWFDLFQSAGILGSLWLAGRSFRFDGKVRRVTNLFEIAEHHRQIWSNFYARPDLARVRDPDPDLRKKPITIEEELFVTQAILHVSGVFQATKEGVIEPIDGMEADIRNFFRKPIPEEVWRRRREFQDLDFVRFVERLLC
jgi:hypothetical protein